MKGTKKSFLTSLISLLLCFSMLLGTTYAWFTDSATSAGNKIQAGTLDIELRFWKGTGENDYEEINDESDPLFGVGNSDALATSDGQNTVWEPGKTQTVYLSLKNAGNLDLKYKVAIEAYNVIGNLISVMQYQITPDAKFGDTVSWESGSTAKEGANTVTKNDTALKAGEEHFFALSIHMDEEAGNSYMGGSVDFDIRVLATQLASEYDSTGNDYDKDAEWPDFGFKNSSTAVAPVTPDVDGKTSEEVNMSSTDGRTSAAVPAGVKLDSGVNELTLNVKDVVNSKANITLAETEATASVDVHIEGIAEDNEVVMAIAIKELLPKGLNMGNYRLYHVENGATVAMTLLAAGATPVHNNFEYDPATGDTVLYLKSFSEVALVADNVNAWAGKFDYTWYDASKTELTIANADQLAAFGAIVGGMNGQTQDSFKDKTVKLIADINLGDAEAENNPDLIFYPIGYYNSTGSYEKTSGGSVTSSVSSFEGTFDGNGNTIANFYQNTWEMFGDYNSGYSGTPNHYKDAMGLFGYVLNGIVKNLTVSNFSSDGEYTPTGVIAAYADGNSTFENIAITNCNPRVYNTGNGGIIGIAGDTSAANDDHITLKNITVDNSNKISALWGSWDVACGGLVGMYRGNVDGNGNATGDTISFENCHVSAIIDVYNDVCANYQYYAYRYSGMIIGSVRHNTTNTEGKTIPNMTGISASGCTVNYGDWNDYYYCEFEKNSMASYSPDYQFSRVPHSELNFTDSNGNGVVDADERASVTGCKHTHTKEENHQAIYLPFHQLFTGYSWGVSSIGLEKYSGIVTNLDITEGDQEESVVKFETKFTGDFLYRVGNKNTVSIGSLFAAKDGVTISNAGVWVKVEKLDENSNVSGTFTANTTDWTKGTIKFEGTGVVKVTIQDYNFCEPTVLLLEVVDAVNATSATSATDNNVVLLQNISGSFTVSNGHTFYGNGFTVTLPTNSVQEKGQGFTGFVSIGAAQDSGAATGGNLDNVRIVGPEYPEMYLYRSQAEITDKNDPDYGNGTNMRYFRNSVIVYGGNCTISNSCISGCRTPVCLRGGNNVVIENTTLSGGSVANMQVAGVNSLVLRDLTTEGSLGIYVDSSAVEINVEGKLNQYNWITQEEWTTAIGGAANAKFFPEFFTDEKYKNYQHKYNDQTYVNVAFIFACDWSADKLNFDQQSNKNIYEVEDDVKVTTPNGTVNGGVYSVASQTLTAELYNAPEYKSTGFNPIAPNLEFDNTPNADPDDTNDANDTYCVYNESTGVLKIGISGDSKTLDLSKISITKNGVDLAHTIYLNNVQISGNSVTIKSADGAKQTLTFKATSNDAGYDKDGNPIAGSIEYTWTVTVEVAVLSYPAPEWNMGGNYQFNANDNCVYAYYGTSNGYGEAVPIYEGIKINYYDKSGKLVKLDLTGTTTHPTGSANSNSNAFTYTLSDGSTLTMKYSSGWKSGATTHQFTTYDKNGKKVYIYPQSLDNDNYIRAKITNQDFDVKISYTFTDPNGQSISQTMRWYSAKGTSTDQNGKISTVQWKTFDSTNGKKPSTCVTPDTLVTLADGTQKRIDEVTVNDQLRVWNFYTGKYDVASASIIMNHGANTVNVTTLNFSDGTSINTINGHGFFDVATNEFVLLDENNAADYVGHSFVKVDGDGYSTVELVSYSVEEQYTEVWSILTSEYYNCVLEGMWTVTAAEVENSPEWLMPYEIGEDMKYDEAKMQADIEKYGLYTYEDFAAYMTVEQFAALGLENFKVSVGKGYITFEEILYLISIHIG